MSSGASPSSKVLTASARLAVSMRSAITPAPVLASDAVGAAQGAMASRPHCAGEQDRPNVRAVES